MDTLETRKLLEYSIDIFDIQEFKEYYDEHTNNFTDFARSAFLKSISIPPTYFLEQPNETKEELLCNKLDLVKVQKKYAGYSIIVVSLGSQIINATKMKTSEVDAKYQAVSSIEDVEGIVWNRSLIKDGYSCGYLVCGTVTGKGQNKAIFIDLPILFNKPTIIHEGYIELANAQMPVEKDMIYYTQSNVVDYYDFQHVALAIQDVKDKFSSITTTSVDKEPPKVIYREAMDVLCELAELKSVPKTLVLPIERFMEKNEIGSVKPLTTQNLLVSLISFDENIKSIKQINALRDSKNIIDSLHKEKWSIKREESVIDSE